MAVYYKFKSAKDYDSIPIEGQFISVANLKERIFESKHLGRGTDFDLMISNAQNNEEYVDEAAMIPKNTSVLIRRIPGRPRKPLVTQRDEPKIIENTSEELPPQSSLFPTSTNMNFPEESEWDEFGNDLYATPDVVPAQSSNPTIDVSTANMIDEENKIKALIETPALDWSRQGQDGFGGGRGFGRGMGGRMMSGRGFGRGGPGYERPFERKTPPAGYVCHRCKVPGHLIQHCPTNGDPSYDVRKMKPPTGIPKSMLMTTPDGSYSLPSGAVAVLKPNEDAFEKEIQGIPTTRPASDLPPELRCPLCKEVMKDAVLTSKCCFRSFCDKCIRDYIISNSMCQCGATDTLADDLLPNKTLRETISRIMESTSSAENAGSQAYVQDMQSTRPVPPKIRSPARSAVSKDEPKKSHTEKSSGLKVELAKEDDVASKGKAIDGMECSSDKNAPKTNEPLEAMAESISNKVPASPANVSAPEDVQEKVPGDDQGKKKKKKKKQVPGNAADMQWRGFQNPGAENYVGMPMGHGDYNPYWNGGMQMGFDGFMPPFGGPMPYMGYGPGPVNVPFGAPGPFDIPFGGPGPFDVPFGAPGPFDVPFNAPDPFAAQGYMMPPFPQTRDLSEMGYSNMNKNIGPPMSREEFEAKKADIRRKRERERDRERLSEREHVKDGKGVTSNSGADVSSYKEKPRLMSRADRPDRTERSDPDRRHHDHPPPSKRRSSIEREEAHKPEPDAAPSELFQPKSDKLKASVFSRISFPGSSEPTKKRKSSETDMATSNGVSVKEHHDRHHHDRHHGHSNGYRSSEEDEDDGEDDDDYHFKRRPSRRHGEREEGRSSSRSGRDHGHDKRR